VRTDENGFTKRGAEASVGPDLLSEILAAAADVSMVVSAEGRILSVLTNPQHRAFANLRRWEGKHLSDVLAPESLTKIEARIAEFQRTGGLSRSVEVNHVDDTVWEFPIRYTLHRFQPQGAILMLGRDLRQIAEMQQQLVAAQMALERDYESQREIDTRYRVLMEATRDAFVVVAMSSGRIADMNVAAAQMLGGSRQELTGAAIAQEFEGRRRGEFLESVANLAVAESSAPIELIARRSQRRLFMTPTVFRAAGERLLMCRLESAEAGDGPPDELSENLVALYHEGVDGIVFTDREGVIRYANEAFLNLADAANLSAVKGRSLGDFLARGAVDLKVLIENARRAGHMRMYATKVTTAYEGRISAEISASWIDGRPAPFMVFVIRDASRADALRRPGLSAADESGRSVMELVGSATLKDIVAETTDVVEKMCIETAVELTRNNRVAAAEMLGLSRQSLYVKLRKYGLLNKDGD
jgi:transcriptional regulator PpsR